MASDSLRPAAATDLPANQGCVRVILFAGMAELAGRRSLEVAWEGGTVGELRSRLAAACPAVEPLLVRSAVACGDRYAADGESLPPGGEVAIIPPVSGG